MQNLERKKKGTNTRKNKHEKAHFQSHDTACHCEPVHQNEFSIVNGCGAIFDEKVLRNYRRMNGTTDRCKPVYPPLFKSRGIIRKNKQDKSRYLSPDTTCRCYSLYQI